MGMRKIGLSGWIVALLLVTPAFAHHPGSHAERLSDGRVSLDAVATAADICIRIVEVQAGAPPGIAAVAGSAPVTVRLGRTGSASCTAALSAVHLKVMLDLPREARQLLLYVLAPDGSVAATERVPVR